LETQKFLKIKVLFNETPTHIPRAQFAKNVVHTPVCESHSTEYDIIYKTFCTVCETKMET